MGARKVSVSSVLGIALLALGVTTAALAGDEEPDKKVKKKMVWVGGEPHGDHLSMHSAWMGKGGYLGVQLTDLTPELRGHFGVDEDEGVLVAKVLEDTPAFRAGLEVGDIITRVDGQTVGSSVRLAHLIRGHEEGNTVTFEIWRQGAPQSISATLDELEGPGRAMRMIEVDCDDDEEDCRAHLAHHFAHGAHFGCPEGERCEIEIKCSDGDCDCVVNEETIDCSELRGFSDD